MVNALRPLIVLAAIGGVMMIGAGAEAADPPLWVQHVQNYDGGISNGVRARLDAGGLGSGLTATATIELNNVQMNADSDPPLPQDETSVAYKVSNPLIAVAAANDFVGDGDWIGRTTDGGRTWASTFKDPKTSIGTRCFGGDPSVVYSVRDQAFYLSTLCFFGDASSEVQVWKSSDDGATWTDSFKASLVISNRVVGGFDESVFYDKELLAVDNNALSAHFGRLYITYVKFHLTPPNGRSDFCPVQAAFTDRIPTNNPAKASWTNVAVVPDDPAGGGRGAGANQWAMPVVDSTSALDIAYALEDCNTGLDRGFFFRRSTDGGNTFSAPLQIDKPGQFADNPNTKDKLNPKKFRAPISPSLAFNPVTGSLSFAYQNNVNRQTSGADISLQQSRDFGATWTDAKTISTTAGGAAAPNDQFFPWLAVDEAGNLHAIWYDNRNDPKNTLIETFQAFSSNDGRTWRSWDISSVAWNPDDGFFGCGCFIGDYNAIAASTQVVYPVWTDGRNSAGPPLGQTDIFTNVEIGGIR